MSSKSVQSTSFSSPETSVPLSTTSGKSTTAPMSTTIASVKKFKVNENDVRLLEGKHFLGPKKKKIPI